MGEKESMTELWRGFVWEVTWPTKGVGMRLHDGMEHER